MIDFLRISIRLADFLISNCSKNGLLAKYIDLRRKKTYGYGLFDLGDYAPFIYWIGILLNTDKYKRYVEYQTKNIFRILTKKIFSANDFADLVLGLVLLYELSNRKYYLNHFEKLLSFIEKMFLHNSYICSYNIYGKKIVVAFPGYTGSILEEMCRVYEFTGKDTLLDMAFTLAEPWVQDYMFKKYAIFLPYYKFPSSVLQFPFKLLTGFDFKTAIIMKPNTNMIFGLLKLYQITKDREIKNAIEKWIKSIIKNAKRNFFYSCITISGKKKIINLETNNAIMEILLTSYITMKKDSYLSQVKKMINVWLSLKNRNGLIRVTPERTLNYFTFIGVLPIVKKINGNVSRIDPSVDFAINLLRLFDITKNHKYLKESYEIFRGIIKYHFYKGGFLETISLNNLKPLSYKIECKYLGLLLKGLLTLYHVKSGGEIYKNNLIKNLIRDR